MEAGRRDREKDKEIPTLHDISQNLPFDVKKHKKGGEKDELSSIKGRWLKINKKCKERLNNPATILLLLKMTGPLLS